jgi:hypothetical protein
MLTPSLSCQNTNIHKKPLTPPSNTRPVAFPSSHGAVALNTMISSTFQEIVCAFLRTRLLAIGSFTGNYPPRQKIDLQKGHPDCIFVET